MRVRVMTEGVAAADDLAHEIRPAGRALADHEERGARVMAIEQVEDARRIVIVRAVIDRQPDGGSIGREVSVRAANALRRRGKQGVEQERISSEEGKRRRQTLLGAAP